MKMLLSVTRPVLLVLVVGDLVIAMSNSSRLEVANESVPVTTSPLGTARRAIFDSVGTTTTKKPKKKKSNSDRSTSSDSKDRKEDSSGEDTKDDDSLGLSDEEDDYAEKKKKSSHNKYMPKSSLERHGWRKWHRKCTPCEEEQKTKWRNPGIKWICGAYQTARRSFKSPCTMRLRNCQDGTMFVKIHDHRCKDDPEHGKHFFYDYRVRLTDESIKSSDSEEKTEEDEDTVAYSSDDTRRTLRRRRIGGIAKSLVLNGTAFNITAPKISVSKDNVDIGTTANGRRSNGTTTLQPQIVHSSINQPKS